MGDLNTDGHCDIAVGASHAEPNQNGAVFVILLDALGLPLQPAVRIDPPFPSAAFSRFGSTVAPLGDLTGDGVCDLAVGANAYSPPSGPANSGGVFLYPLGSDGQPQGLTQGFPITIDATTPGIAPLTIDAGDAFGRAVGSVDVDGDGEVELLVGAPSDDDGGSGDDFGAVYVIFLDGFTISSVTKISRQTSLAVGLNLTAGDQFGVSLSPVGDLDGDLTPDLLVGAPSANGSTGEAWVVLLNSDGSAKQCLRIAQGLLGFDGVLQPGDLFGNAVGVMRDLDFDGDVELVVGAPGEDGVSINNGGAVWLLRMDDMAGVEVAETIKIGPDSSPFLSGAVAGAQVGSALASGQGGPCASPCTSLFDLLVGGVGNPGYAWLVDIMDGRWENLGQGLAGVSGVPQFVSEGGLAGSRSPSWPRATGSGSRLCAGVVDGSAATAQDPRIPLRRPI